MLGIQLIIGQVRKALGRAVVVLHVEPAADDILPQRAPGPGIHERLVQRLTGAGPACRGHRADRAVVQAIAERIDEVHRQVEALHEREDLGGTAPGDPEDHAHGVGELCLSLSTAGDRRVRVRILLRRGYGVVEDLAVLLRSATVE